MLSFFPETLELYVERHSEPESDLLAELAEETRAGTDLPQMMVGPVEGALLRTLVRFSGARRVLEIGTFTGYSALSIAMGLPEDGSIITCDIDEHATSIARRFWARHPAGSRIHLRMGPALETIAELDAPLDFVFIDADKTNYIAYYDAVVPLLRTGGLVVADNVLWSGHVVEPAAQQDEDTRALVAFNKHVNADARVENVMLSVRDGILLAVKVRD